MAETPAKETRETHGFQTEVQKLLDLMIHSLYSNKEIFLRELISNASDAADKLRFEALSDDGLYEGDGELKVRVSFDSDARTITVRDNGVGMTREEVAVNLGTIARSGTRQFFESLTGDSARDTQLIGQFGVGFYSSFIVSDQVTVTSRRAGRPAAEGVRWESSGEGEFTVETVDVESRGTEVVLQLRDGEDEFLDRYRLRSIVRKYSDHVSIPIVMPGEGKDDEDEAKDEETINAATAMWTRNKSELSDDDYNGFYKHVAHDFEDPLAWVHSRIEGNLEYSLLLFVPARAPFDLWDRNVQRGVKLYVRRVFIMDDAEHLMPAYLRFVRGVIDSADLPAQHLPRDPAGEPPDPVDPHRGGEAGARSPRRNGQGRIRQVREVLGHLRPGAQGRRGRGQPQPGPDREAPAVRIHPRSGGCADRLARRLRLTHEGRSEGHLLHHRRRLPHRAQQPASRSVRQARPGGAAARRPHRRVAGHASDRVRRQAARIGHEG